MRFVVQRHRARRLHYDLRLELDGVLVSWAVPKGPTLDPKSRQLAVQVGDHALSYYDFEGVIAKGRPGGGDVIVWDWGTWQPAKTTDPAAAIAAGELHFDLLGESSPVVSCSSTARATVRRTGSSSTRTTTTPGPAGIPRRTRVR